MCRALTEGRESLCARRGTVRVRVTLFKCGEYMHNLLALATRSSGAVHCVAVWWLWLWRWGMGTMRVRY